MSTRTRLISAQRLNASKRSRSGMEHLSSFPCYWLLIPVIPTLNICPIMSVKGDPLWLPLSHMPCRCMRVVTQSARTYAFACERVPCTRLRAACDFCMRTPPRASAMTCDCSVQCRRGGYDCLPPSPLVTIRNKTTLEMCFRGCSVLNRTGCVIRKHPTLWN